MERGTSPVVSVETEQPPRWQGIPELFFGMYGFAFIIVGAGIPGSNHRLSGGVAFGPFWFIWTFSVFFFIYAWIAAVLVAPVRLLFGYNRFFGLILSVYRIAAILNLSLFAWILVFLFARMVAQ